jgi:hypothetical protein
MRVVRWLKAFRGHKVSWEALVKFEASAGLKAAEAFEGAPAVPGNVGLVAPA